MKKLLMLFFAITMVYNQTEGCTDPVACNFDPQSVIDDGSCIYEGFYEEDFNHAGSLPDGWTADGGWQVVEDTINDHSIQIIGEFNTMVEGVLVSANTNCRFYSTKNIKLYETRTKCK